MEESRRQKRTMTPLTLLWFLQGDISDGNNQRVENVQELIF